MSGNIFHYLFVGAWVSIFVTFGVVRHPLLPPPSPLLPPLSSLVGHVILAWDLVFSCKTRSITHQMEFDGELVPTQPTESFRHSQIVNHGEGAEVRPVLVSVRVCDRVLTYTQDTASQRDYWLAAGSLSCTSSEANISDPGT